MVPVPSVLLPGFADVVVTSGGIASNLASFLVIPVITNDSPLQGPVGTSVVVTGTSFGDTQGSSTVTFNGVTASPTSWSDTGITVPVPAGATTGPIEVTVNGFSTNGRPFPVVPNITAVGPTAGQIGSLVTLSGTTFGQTQGFGGVTFNGVSATVQSWSDSSITVLVPSGATSGNVVVTDHQLLASNGVNFSVIADTTPPTITATVLPSPNAAGWNNSQIGVLFACGDDQSGVASCPSFQTISTEGINQAVSGTATDNVGNSSSVSVNVNIDITPPVLSITSPSDGSTVAVSTASIAGTVSDLLSGVASVQCNGIVGSLSSGSFLCQVNLNAGFNQIQITATDVAGNQATSSIGITSLAPPPIPISAIFLTPSQVNLLVSQSRSLKVVSDQGASVPGATLAVNDPTIVQITDGQLTALQPGTTVITATLQTAAGPLSATSNVSVFAGAQLPDGVPLWGVSPLPQHFAFDGVFAYATTDDGPGIYSVESTSGFSSLAVRALGRDGEALWSAPITAATLQAAATTIPVLKIASEQLAGDGMLAADDTEFIRSNASVNRAESILQQLKSQGGKYAKFADAVSRQVTQIRSHYPSLEELRAACLKRTEAITARFAARVGTLSAAYSATSPMTSQASTLDSSVVYIPVKQVSDPQGGLIVQLHPLGCCNVPETLLRIDPSTQAVSWHYDAEGIGDFAIRGDGTIFTFTVTSAAANTVHTHVIALDLITGAQKFSVPLDGQIFLGASPFPASQLVLECNCVRTGTIMIAPDGNAHLSYSTSTGNVVVDSTANTVTATIAYMLNLLTVDDSGNFSIETLRSFTGKNTIFSGPDGSPQEQITDPLTAPLPDETIPDGSDGLLTAWTFNNSGGSDCIWASPGAIPQCTLGATEVDARITHNGSDYVLPMGAWTGGNISVDPGGTLVLGQNNTAFAFNGFTIAAVQTDTGTVSWSAPLPPHTIPATLVGATEDGGVMLNLPTGEIAQYDTSGNSTLSTFQFFISDVDEQSNLFGQDPNGNVQLQPRKKSLARSVWNPRGGFAKGRTGTLLTKEITVIGWINGLAVTFPSSDSVSSVLRLDLNVSCAITIFRFLSGDRSLINSDADRQYVNSFLIANSNNHEPPPTLDSSILKRGDFRAFNRLQATINKVGSRITTARPLISVIALGNTIDSCSSIFTPTSALKPEPHPDNGKTGTTPSGLHFFQLNEGRVGADGQKVNMTLNACTSKNAAGLCNAPAGPTVPYIWSFPLFDPQAQYTVEHQIFPTYYIYEDGKLVNKAGQSALEDFIKLNSSSQVKASDIQ